MIYGDNQTRHFYVVTSPAGVVKKALANTDKFRLNIHQGGNNAATTVTATTDIFDKKLIKDVRVSEPKGIGTRTWTFAINTSSNLKAATDYHLYFYLENLLGFGVQDRMDRVASYTTPVEADMTASAFYIGIACDLYNKVLAAGPVKGDFTIYVTTSGSDVEIKPTSGTSVSPDMISATATGIKIVETTPSVDDWDVVMHNFPYKYNVTISSAYGENNDAWIYQSSDTVREAKPTVVYGHNGVVLYDMEHYFMRNRGDLYDVNPNFYTSIKNAQYVSMSGDYACVDVCYAFSDGLGFTYHSDKNLTIAVTATTASDFTAFAQATANDPGSIVKDSGHYYYLPDGHTTNVTLANTNKIEIEVGEGYAYQIAELFK